MNKEGGTKIERGKNDAPLKRGFILPPNVSDELPTVSNGENKAIVVLTL